MLFELGVMPDLLQNLPLLGVSDPFEEVLRFFEDVCVKFEIAWLFGRHVVTLGLSLIRRLGAWLV